MAGNIQNQAYSPERRVGRVSIDDFVLHLKELQLIYGHAIKWKFHYVARRINVVVVCDSGRVKSFIACLSSSKMDNGHPDLVSSVKFGSKETFLGIESFRKLIIGAIEKL